MKKIIFLMMAVSLLTAGCSKKEKKYIPFSANNSAGAPLQSGSAATNVTGATLSQIQVSPADQSIAKNTHATYTATGIYSDGTIKDISTECTWSVKSETDKASTVESKKGRFLGTAVTTAGSPVKVNAVFGSLSGDANLNITNATLSSIQISSVPSLIPGGTAQYIATGVFSDGTTQDISSLVNWSSSNASNVTMDATTGIGTGGNTAGTATITATLISPSTFPTVSNGGSASTTTQLKNVTIVSITVTGASSVGAGSSTGYLASAIYSDGTSSDITNFATWSLSSSVNAGINDSAGSKGILTGVSAGSVNVQATYAGITGTKEVTITGATVTGVIVSPSSKTIAKGTTTQFTATATYSDGTTRDVTNSAVWSSSNGSVAGVNTSASTGGLSQGIAAGSSTITATTGGKSGTASLTVTNATLVSIAIGGPFTIANGTTKQYTATGTYSDGSTQDISSLVSWTSSSTSNATISNASGTKGLATAVGTGSSTIQASLNGINSNASTLNISSATLVSIAIGSDASVSIGSTKQYTATGTYSDASTQDLTSLVTWRSATTSNVAISNAVSDKGLAYGLAIGTSNITASLGAVTSNTSVLTVGAASSGSTTNSVVSGYNVTVPSGLVTGTSPTGDFSGIVYQGNPAQVAGFVSTVNYGGTAGCTNFGTSLLSAMINDTPNVITANNQISSNVIGTNPDCSAVYVLSVTTNTSLTVTGLSNHLIEEIGKTIPGGTISNLPVATGSQDPTTAFRVVLQATYSTTGNELVGVAVSRESDYASNAALIASLLDGTNINPTGSTNTNKTDMFVATADPKVDFVWVVDNSGSMSEEQASVVSNAGTFFTKLGTKHLDFRLGVIATGSTGSNNCKMNAQNPAWALWGTGWTTAANGSTAFSNNVSSVGLSGCGTDETGIFFMERSLGVHTGVTATVVPRSGAKLIFVILSDEGDGYTTMANKSGANAPSTTFNTASNTFVTNGYKVYSIIGLNSSTNQPGTCSGSGTSASNGNNSDTKYYNLATATGGSSGTICSTDYSALLDNIATQAAGSASAYTLSKTPVSSTLVVKVNGVTVAQDATNGWQYNSATKTIVFSGTAWPTEGANISVTYDYNSSANVAFGSIGDSNLMAYISKTAKSDTARGAAAAIALLVGAILAGRIWRNRKHN
jgi:hypothetical protein